MLVWLLRHVAPLLTQLEGISTGDSRVFLSFRVACAAVVSFVTALVLGPIAIAWLKSRFTERIDSGSSKLNELHASKASTPTMGGIFIVAALILSALVCADLENDYVQQALIVLVGFSTLGGVDDWVKISSRKNGLTARQKFYIQVLLGLLVSALLYSRHIHHPHGVDFIWPFGGITFSLGPVFILWGAFVMTGTSNGVNLTDGLDGLAAGCLVFSGGAFAVISYLAGHRIMSGYFGIPFISGAGELSVLFGAMTGAMLGFLWYNCYPAQVFMGDTGSLPTGALLGFGAMVIRQEVLLALVGGVFVIETISVILQVGSFRLTGKRLILCSPLHNHFLFRGDHEMKIVVRFWIGSALLALISIASLKIR